MSLGEMQQILERKKILVERKNQSYDPIKNQDIQKIIKFSGIHNEIDSILDHRKGIQSINMKDKSFNQKTEKVNLEFIQEKKPSNPVHQKDLQRFKTNSSRIIHQSQEIKTSINRHQVFSLNNSKNNISQVDNSFISVNRSQLEQKNKKLFSEVVDFKLQDLKHNIESFWRQKQNSFIFNLNNKERIKNESAEEIQYWLEHKMKNLYHSQGGLLNNTAQFTNFQSQFQNANPLNYSTFNQNNQEKQNQEERERMQSYMQGYSNQFASNHQNQQNQQQYQNTSQNIQYQQREPLIKSTFSQVPATSQLDHVPFVTNLNRSMCEQLQDKQNMISQKLLKIYNMTSEDMERHLSSPQKLSQHREQLTQVNSSQKINEIIQEKRKKSSTLDKQLNFEQVSRFSNPEVLKLIQNHQEHKTINSHRKTCN